MKNPQESARILAGLFRKISKASKPAVPPDGDAVTVMVMSFLMWDSTTAKARAAFKRIMERVVDFNDLRVSMPYEMMEWLGPRYPMGLERCQRLRAALRHTYKREHAICLDRLGGMGRREVKRYLRSLDGIAPYVADRVTLLCFDAHCIPVDERLRGALIKAGICDESVQIAELSSWLARQVKAADAASTHLSLQAWSDRVGISPPAGSPSSVRGSPGKRQAMSTTRPRTAGSRRV